MDNFKLSEFKELLFEVSTYRSSILKQIDNNFKNIKENPKDLAAKKELIENIRKFTGVKHITLSIKPNYFNAAIISIYNQNMSLDLLNLLKDYKVEGNIRELDVVEEPSKYINKIYIIIGKQILEEFSPREITSIFLHELGHCFTYTSNLPRLFLSIFDKLFLVSGSIVQYSIKFILNASFFPLFVASLLISFIVMRSLTFLEHKSEYRADQFAVKYGYGDEIIKVLYRLKNNDDREGINKSFFSKVFDFIKMIFSVSTHPSNSKRIKEINSLILKDYKKLYPKLSKELNIILQDV
jgi:hypothetical protein